MSQARRMDPAPPSTPLQSMDGFYRMLLDHITDGVYFVDHERRITFWNRGAERLTGFSQSEVIGTLCHDNILNHVDECGLRLCQCACPLVEAMTLDRRVEREAFFQHKKGHRVPVKISVNPIHDADGRIAGAVEVFGDARATISLREQLQMMGELALLDPLTRLANRRSIRITLKSRLEEMSRYGTVFGLALIDIDHFKKVNDRYGHEVGDAVLEMAAGTLERNIRPFDRLGRWGGEEFIVIFPKVDALYLSLVCERLRILVERSSLREREEPVSVTVSIGATLARPEDKQGSVLRRADQLLYRSKEAGRNRVTMD